MRVALPLQHYPPAAEQQKHLHALVQELTRRGHQCVLFCSESKGEPIPGAELHVLRVRGFRQRSRERNFLRALAAALAAEPVDIVVGFALQPGLDVYFAVNGPLADQGQGAKKRRAPDNRRRVALERAVFASAGKTQVLALKEAHKTAFQLRYQTPDERFHLLPPVVGTAHRVPDDGRKRRAAQRQTLALAEGELTLLCVGDDYQALGLDRAITALAHMREQQPALPVRLLVVGQDGARPYVRLARQLGVKAEVHFFGAQADLLDLMLAADVLVHPATSSKGDGVLVEALAVGLPVVTTEICGYAALIRAARGGLVLASPFSQEMLNAALMRNIDGIFRADCRADALAYAAREDLWQAYRVAADHLERVAETGRSTQNGQL